MRYQFGSRFVRIVDVQLKAVPTHTISIKMILCNRMLGKALEMISFSSNVVGRLGYQSSVLDLAWAKVLNFVFAHQLKMFYCSSEE